MLFVGTEIWLLDGKNLIKKECLQSTYKSNDNVTHIAYIDCYRVPDGSCRMSKGTRCNRSRTSSRKQVMISRADRIAWLVVL